MNKNSKLKYDSIDKNYNHATKIPKLKSSDIAEPSALELDEYLGYIEI